MKLGQNYLFTSLADCISRNRVPFRKAQPDDLHGLKITFCLINVTSLKHLYNLVSFRKMPATKSRVMNSRYTPQRLQQLLLRSSFDLKLKRVLCALLKYQSNQIITNSPSPNSSACSSSSVFHSVQETCLHGSTQLQSIMLQSKINQKRFVG